MLYKGELPGINQIVAELVNRLNSEIIQVVCFCKKTVERLWGFNISLFRFCEFDGFNGSKLIFLLLLQQQNLLEKAIWPQIWFIQVKFSLLPIYCELAIIIEKKIGDAVGISTISIVVCGSSPSRCSFLCLWLWRNNNEANKYLI